MPGYDVIAVGASAGGVKAITRLVRDLPRDFGGSIFVAQHVPPTSSILPAILHGLGRLPAGHARDGEPIELGRIYVAPPDRHLMVEPGRVRVGTGPRENGHRPSVDVLFRSAALAYRERTAALVLTGALDDGAAGLVWVKRLGGFALVQDPDDADYRDMPLNAIAATDVDRVLPLEELASVLAELPSMSRKTPKRPLVAAPPEALGGIAPVFSCPECKGPLRELDEGRLLHYVCRTGHAYNGESLAAEQAAEVESALWTAIRSLEEARDVALRLEERARRSGRPNAARRFAERARESAARADLIRRALQARPTAVPAPARRKKDRGGMAGG